MSTTILKEKIILAHKIAECIVTCNYCFNACLDEDDVKMMKNCIRLNKECVQICEATLSSLYKQNKFAKDLIALCKKVCNMCADECSKHHYDHCKRCSQACTDCASACDSFIDIL